MNIEFKDAKIVEHSDKNLEEVIYFMQGYCMNFSRYLHKKLNKKGTIVGYVERWATAEYEDKQEEIEKQFKEGELTEEEYYALLDKEEANQDNYAVDSFSVTHIGYKLPNGIIVDAQNFYTDDDTFESYIKRNYEILYPESYYEDTQERMENNYPYLKEEIVENDFFEEEKYKEYIENFIQTYLAEYI